MQVRDVDLHVVDSGTGDPALLLVHGFTGSSLDWVDVQPALARSRRVVMYDHRGHGDSTNTGDPASYTFDALVGDLEALVDGLGLDGFHLLGHSMGGVVSLRYALAHPDRLRSLVLMDTFAAPAGVIPEAWITNVVGAARAGGMAAVAEPWMAFVDERVRDRVATKLAAMDPEAFAALAQELGAFPSLVDRLGELRLPVTVLVGENDTNLVAPAELMAASITGADLVVMPGCAHSPQEDDPAAWLAAIDAHLARADPAR